MYFKTAIEPDRECGFTNIAKIQTIAYEITFRDMNFTISFEFVKCLRYQIGQLQFALPLINLNVNFATQLLEI